MGWAPEANKKELDKDSAIVKTDDLPIVHEGNVHNGKVRSVYWLQERDNKRLAHNWDLPENAELGIMVISDRISAYECKWQSESGFQGVPGKGAALNAISKYWFDTFQGESLANHHILAVPHPLVWIVQKAEPILIEAIARQYITGSMWRDYNEKGVRVFGGVKLPDGLKKDQRLDQILITPTTKGIIKGIDGIPEQDDVNITLKQIQKNYKAFGFKSKNDIEIYERLLTAGFKVISEKLDSIGKIFVDTKFEFGYVPVDDGHMMIYMDEIGTPDSSRYWDKAAYKNGKTIEESKEKFRQELLASVPDRDILLNKDRMAERIELAKTFRVPDHVFMETSALYKSLAEQITGESVRELRNVRAQIEDSLMPYGLLK